MSKQQLKSEVTGSIWKIETAVGQALEEGHTVLIIESMKMEIPLVAEDGGTLVEILVAEGDAIVEGQVLAIVEL
ncbi:MAG: acetyl-CoA carboxylase biotin carboxyl carrier protein subunit [Burkholderiales bacterium]